MVKAFLVLLAFQFALLNGYAQPKEEKGSARIDSVRTVKRPPVEIFGSHTSSEVAIRKSEIYSQPAETINRLVQPATLTEAIRTIHPSLDVRRYGTLGSVAFPSFRGMPSEYTIAYSDGVRLTNEQNSLIDLGKYSFVGIEKIEVIPSSSSILLGGDAIGAAINLITQLPSDVTSVSFKNQLTSYDDLSTAGEKGHFLSLSSKLTDQFGVVLNGAVQYSNGKFPFTQFKRYRVVRENNDARLETVNGALQYWFSPEATFTLRSFYLKADRGAAGPATIDEKGTSSPHARQKDEDILFSAQQTLPVGSTGSLLLNASYQSQKENYSNPQVRVDTSTLDDQYINRLYTFAAYLQQRINDKFGLYFGITPSITYLFSNQNAIDKYDSVISRNRIAGFLACSYQPLEALDAALSLRVESYDSPNGWRMAFLPQISLEYEAFHVVNVNAAFSLTHHAPTLNQLYWKVGGNKSLRPERGTNFQLSFANHPWSLGKAFLSLKGTGFYAHVTDEILWQPSAVGISVPENIRDAVIQGIEGEAFLQYALSTSLQLSGKVGITLLSALNKSPNPEENNKEIPHSTPMQSFLSFTAEWMNYGTLGILVRNRDYKCTDLGNTTLSRVPPATLIDVTLTGSEIPLFSGIALLPQFSVLNAGNTSYVELPNYPLPERTFRFSLDIKFQSNDQSNNK